MGIRKKSTRSLDQFTKDVLYSALVSLTSKALVLAAALVAGLGVALVATGWVVPAWTLAGMALLALTLVYLARRVAAREARESRPRLSRAEDELDRHDSYGSNLCSALYTFQKIVAKDVDLHMGTFIERGILAPAARRGRTRQKKSAVSSRTQRPPVASNRWSRSRSPPATIRMACSMS